MKVGPFNLAHPVVASHSTQLTLFSPNPDTCVFEGRLTDC